MMNARTAAVIAARHLPPAGEDAHGPPESHAHRGVSFTAAHHTPDDESASDDTAAADRAADYININAQLSLPGSEV